MSNQKISNEVREILETLKNTDGEILFGCDGYYTCQKLKIDSALSAILALTDKPELVPLDEKEVEKVLLDYDQTLFASSQRTFKGYAHAICSHFSKLAVRKLNGEGI